MGLAGRKDKQRLSTDPNNKAWSDSTSKLGYRLLSSMGWKSGAGLGKDLDGINKHVAVKLKKDVLGVGADKCTIDNWLDNTSAFDALLQSLNSGTKEVEEVVEKKEVKKEGNGRNSHRSKWLRNKSVGDFDATSLDQILGVRHGKKKVEEEEKSGGFNMVEYFAKMKGNAPASTTDEHDEGSSFTGGLGFGSPGLGLGFQQEETIVTLVDEGETVAESMEDKKKSKKRKREKDISAEDGSSKKERKEIRMLRKQLKESKRAEKEVKRARKTARASKKAEKEVKKARKVERELKKERKVSKKGQERREVL
jgi:Pin2-interacting protein X1